MNHGGYMQSQAVYMEVSINREPNMDLDIT